MSGWPGLLGFLWRCLVWWGSSCAWRRTRGRERTRIGRRQRRRRCPPPPTGGGQRWPWAWRDQSPTFLPLVLLLLLNGIVEKEEVGTGTVIKVGFLEGMVENYEERLGFGEEYRSGRRVYCLTIGFWRGMSEGKTT